MRFYTSINRYGNSLLYRGYEDGVRVKKKIKFKPTLYLKSKNVTNFKTLDDVYVDPIKFDDMRSAKDFTEKYKDVNNFVVYGNTNYIAQFIAEQFPNEITFDREVIRVHAIDVETPSNGQGFPEPKDAKFPVVALTIYDSVLKTYYAWGLDDYDKTKTELKNVKIEYSKCSSEEVLLKTFVKFWNDEFTCPDVVTGWNIRGFDIPYLVNRIFRVLGEEYVKMLSPWRLVEEKMVTMKRGQVQIYDIIGIAQLDYMDLFQKFGYSFGPQENYRLDTIANVVLGENKMSYEEYGTLDNLYKENHQRFLDYNVKDVWLIERMEDKIAMITLAMSMAYKAGVNYNDTFGTTGIWDSLIHRYLMNQNIVVPPNVDKFKGEYEGAYCKEVQAGVHDWVVSFDIASLYPNIIVQWNMSPETILKGEFVSDMNVERMLTGYKNTREDASLAASGQYFSNAKLGFLPKIIEEMYDERVVVKKKMLESKKELERSSDTDAAEIYRIERDIAHYENHQTAIKILLNSCYGALGSRYFRYFSMEMAESITLTGQYVIKWAENKVNVFLNKTLKTNKDYVLASDTDSVAGSTMITVNNEKLSIEDFYNSIEDDFIKNDMFNNDFVKNVHRCVTLSISNDGELQEKPISYVMKHRVKKELFKITNSHGHSVIVTTDHSIVIKDARDGAIKSIKPKSLNPEIHRIINIL